MGNYMSYKEMLKNDSDIPVILWGIGNCYSASKEYIRQCISVDYIHDKKWENSVIAEYDGYKVISLKEISKFGRCAIIICLWNRDIEEEIINEISDNIPNALTYRLRDLSPIDRELKKEEIIFRSEEGIYKDYFGNCIEYHPSVLSDKVSIQFHGLNAKIMIGCDVKIYNKLYIECGNNAVIKIGAKTTFDAVTIYSAYGDIEIGENCMFSYEVFIRNHDSHFIFDAETGNRINYSRAVRISDHVWIGQNAILLAGFAIGTDSIVGAGSVSSSVFPGRVVIAGNPAKIIREGVTWHRDMTYTENYNNISEIR